MRVAVIHDWLTGIRGGEKVLLSILELFPRADIFTIICDRTALDERITKHKITTSFLQGIPGIFTSYRNFLPLFPAAVESFDLKGYDLIISSSHCAAKGIKPPSPQIHACYCHTPMRYAYGQFDNYFSVKRNGIIKYAMISAVMPALRRWDRSTAKRAGFFMANSNAVKGRIMEYYGRESSVVHPPVDTDFYTPGGKKENFFLMVSALTEYKKVDWAVEVFNSMADKKLVIIGGGPLLDKIKNSAGPNVAVLGRKSDEEIRDHYRRARGFIFPGEEDFGITMAEALACGTPVLAFNRGGALDIVTDGETGSFYDGSGEGFIKALEKMENNRYDDKKMRACAERFSKDAFKTNFVRFLAENSLIPSGAKLG
jgi:glycosyltransferase involved in cell wall biosynthesis